MDGASGFSFCLLPEILNGAKSAGPCFGEQMA